MSVYTKDEAEAICAEASKLGGWAHAQHVDIAENPYRYGGMQWCAWMTAWATADVRQAWRGSLSSYK